MNILDREQQLSLLTRLRHLTESGALSWKAATPYQLRTDVGKFTYTLASQDGDDLPPYWFGIGQAEADPSVGFVQIIQSLIDDPNPDERIMNAGLRSLYNVVKRAAFGWEDMAREIFAELDAVESHVEA